MAGSNRVLYISVFLALIAYFYSVYTKQKSKDAFSVEQAVLDAWNRIIEKPSLEFSKILIGINCNVDLIIPGTQLLSKLNITSGKAHDHEEIRSEEQFQESFALFFSRGAPGERYMSDENLFAKATAVAEKLPTAEFGIGGNAALMSQKIASGYSNTKVLLAGPIGPRSRALLHPNIATQNSTKISKDEIHLILEFKQGEIWGDYVAPVSSRFITSHDTFGSSAVVIDMFFNSIITHKPDLVVLSGIHLLEFQPKNVWEEKLKVIRRNLGQINRLIPVHLELGSMADAEFAKSVLHRIVPYVDSVGLNEQELSFMSQAGGGPYAEQSQVVESTSINAYKATEILDWMFQQFGRNKKNPDSKRVNYRLQRIHFHCLTYHMLVTRGSDWSNGPAALAASTRLAGKQACGRVGTLTDLESNMVELRLGSEILLDRVKNEKLQFNPHNPVNVCISVVQIRRTEQYISESNHVWHV